jgi:hypothetical protein
MEFGTRYATTHSSTHQYSYNQSQVSMNLTKSYLENQSQQRLKNQKKNLHQKSKQKIQTQTLNPKTTPTNTSDSPPYKSLDQPSQLWDLPEHKHRLSHPLVDLPQDHLDPLEEDLETYQQHKTLPPLMTLHFPSTAS